jgi:hypothetical protein
MRDLQKSKIGFRYVCFASLARLIASHSNIKDLVEQFEKRPMMLPEKFVSMDQLVSAQLGLIPQMAGFLTNLRIWGATIFAEHFSDYVFVALMQDLTLDETLLAKSYFERHAHKGGVTINSYHANIGRFADSGF